MGTQQAGEFETAVDVRTRQENIGVYVTDTFDITEQLALTLAGRYQHVSIAIRDRSGQNPALDGDHNFSRFSPAAGLTAAGAQEPHPVLLVQRGFRAPTPAELTCADPNAPCNLPNAFLADPPLRPVVARTYEIGARGKLSRSRQSVRAQWNVALFRTNVDDDILFTQHPDRRCRVLPERGRNAPSGCRGRPGGHVEAPAVFPELRLRRRHLPERRDAGQRDRGRRREVRFGDRIPGIPQHNLKLGAEVEILKDLWIGADVIATSGTFLRETMEIGWPRWTATRS